MITIGEYLRTNAGTNLGTGRAIIAGPVPGFASFMA
jgi:hypothetical protein